MLLRGTRNVFCKRSSRFTWLEYFHMRSPSRLPLSGPCPLEYRQYTPCWEWELGRYRRLQNRVPPKTHSMRCFYSGISRWGVSRCIMRLVNLSPALEFANHAEDQNDDYRSYHPSKYSYRIDKTDATLGSEFCDV